RDEPIVDRPAGLERHAICALSGRDATPLCPRVESEWVPTERSEAPCRWHRLGGGRGIVASPPVHRAWAGHAGPAGAALPAPPAPPVPTAGAAPSKSRVRATSAETLRILNPPPGAIYLFDPTLRAAFQTLPLRAVTGAAGTRLSWEVDGRPVGTSEGD